MVLTPASVLQRAQYGEVGDLADSGEGLPVDLATLPEGVSVRDYVSTEAVQREVKRRFGRFLRTYRDGDASREEKGGAKYADVIHRMCSENLQSLEVSYTDLSRSESTIALWMADHPLQIINLLHASAKEVVLSLYPDYGTIRDEIYVRISDLPIVDDIRDIRQIHLNALVKVRGVCTRRSNVFPQLKLVRAIWDRHGVGTHASCRFTTTAATVAR